MAKESLFSVMRQMRVWNVKYNMIADLVGAACTFGILFVSVHHQVMTYLLFRRYDPEFRFRKVSKFSAALNVDTSDPDIPKEFKLKYDWLMLNSSWSTFAMLAIGLFSQKLK